MASDFHAQAPSEPTGPATDRDRIIAEWQQRYAAKTEK